MDEGGIGSGQAHRPVKRRWTGFARPHGASPAFLIASVTKAFRDAVSAALSQRRGFLLFPFALMTGLILYRLMAFEPDFTLVLALVVATAIGFATALHTGRGGLAAGLVFGVTAGIALLPVHGALFGTPMLRGSLFGTYRAEISEVLSQTPSGQRVIVQNIAAIDGRPVPVRRARLFVRAGPALAAGMIISGPMRFAEVPGPPVPGGFDSQFHSYFNGVGAYGNTTRAPQIIDRLPSGPIGALAALRHTIGERLDAGMNTLSAGIARALVIGDQSRIDDATRKNMATAGLAHVLAISGLHLTLVAGGIFALARALLALGYGVTQNVPIKKIAALIGISGALFYLGLSGASVSATRASVTLVLVFGAVLAGRSALTMRNVALAAIFVLCTGPASLFRPGFQLSFAAVAGLIGVFELTRKAEHHAGTWMSRIWYFITATALTSLVAGLATAVFAAYHFQQTAPLSIAGNIAALPVLGFIVLPSLAVSVVAMPLGFEGPLLALASWGIQTILAIATLVAQASTGLILKPLLTQSALIFAFCAAAWFVFFPNRLRLAGPALAALAIPIWALQTSPDVLVADRTQAVAIRTQDGMALATGRVKSFAVDVWSQTFDVTITQKSPAINCDALGCIAKLPGGQQIAIIRNIAALAEDCPTTSLVIARIDTPGWCRNLTQVIDAGDLERGGITAARWNPATKSFLIEPAITDINRPWRIVRRK